MSGNDLNEVLQKKLGELESGVPLEELVTDIPDDAREIIPLLMLAAKMREVPLPSMPSEVANSQKARIMAAAGARRRRVLLPRLPGWLTAPEKGFRLRMGLGFAVIAVIIALGAGFYLTGPASAHSARLIRSSGIVQVASSASSNDWRDISSSEEVHQGQQIRTQPQSSVTLLFFDGSRTTIGPSADLTLTRLGGQWGGSLQVEIDQKTGSTTNDVIPLQGTNSFYRIDTPFGQANVKGTLFNVVVAGDGKTSFLVTQGKVQVKNDLSDVVVETGQIAEGLPGQVVQPPGYPFTLSGSIEAIQPGLWTINKLQIHVTPQTNQESERHVGDSVLVQGRILGPGNWIADNIEPASKNQTSLQFTGVIETMPGVPGDWMISGQRIQVNSQTKLKGTLQVGIAVTVTYQSVPDQSGKTADQIAALNYGEEISASPTPIEVETNTTAPLNASPEAAVTLSLPLAGTPKNDTARCDNQSAGQPEAAALANRYGVSTDEINGWFCKGFGFGEIDQAYQLQEETGTPVGKIFSMRNEGLAWGKIKQELNPTKTPKPTQVHRPTKTPEPKNTKQNPKPTPKPTNSKK